MMEKFIKRNLITILGVLVGALGGYLYWRFVGCDSGTCAITSSPLNSTIYGAIMGGLVFSLFKKREKKDKD
ncbi:MULTISPECIES: DUF6132 family protein [Bacteroides]|nr:MULTISPECIES: DUF6132 family protein [Bacteroides]HJD92764.1 DUF6132 family protein [Bacteroides coprosuis]